jgi:diguanylate cyclase (GGDEF)-like protein
VELSERERYTLRTFASALCTAVRNAQAYAELARVAEEHAHAATHDALTGLANRRHLLDEGAAQLGTRHAEGVTALVLIDLNHFKEVNDTLGHAAGDELLRQVAARLAGVVRPGDTVGRLSGDEFAILLPDLVEPADADGLAGRVVACFDEPFRLEGRDVTVGTSVGVAVLRPGPEATAEQLLREADAAMYQHKQRRERRVGASGR